MVRKKGLPKLGELVLCKVNRITQFAAWCKLEEYPGIEGMIHISEVAGKHVYDIRDFVKKDKQYVAKVIKVDEQKNLVNLSLKRVPKEEEKEKLSEFRREKRAEKILEQASKELNKSLDQGYEEVGFFLQENFGGLFNAFEEIKKSPKLLDELKISEEWKIAIEKVLERALVEKVVTIVGELKVKFYSSDGIEKIKNLLSELEKNAGVSITYISAPRYRVEMVTKNPKEDKKKLVRFLEETMRKVKELSGEGSYTL
jgi:translation initiation factor 2 subunit 1